MIISQIKFILYEIFIQTIQHYNILSKRTTWNNILYFLLSTFAYQIWNIHSERHCKICSKKLGLTKWQLSQPLKKILLINVQNNFLPSNISNRTIYWHNILTASIETAFRQMLIMFTYHQSQSLLTKKVSSHVVHLLFYHRFSRSSVFLVK